MTQKWNPPVEISQTFEGFSQIIDAFEPHSSEIKEAWAYAYAAGAASRQFEIDELRAALDRIFDLTLEPIGPRTAYKALSQIRAIVGNKHSGD